MKLRQFPLLYLSLILFLQSVITIEAMSEPKTTSPKSQFKVGVILPLSAKAAEYGQAMQNGIELLLSDREKDGKRIEFIYEDVQYSPKLAVGAFNKLRNIGYITRF